MLALAFLAASTALAVPAPAEAQVPPELLQARLDDAREAYRLTFIRYQGGQNVDVECVYRWSHRWLAAQQDLSKKRADRVAAAEAHLGRMRELEKLAKARFDAGLADPGEFQAAKFYVTEAKVWLARAKGD